MKSNPIQYLICLFLCFADVWAYAESICIAPGIFYECIMRDNPAQKIYLVRIDPKRVSIGIQTAEEYCIGAKTTSDIAQRSDAAVAINGSFFDFMAASRTAQLCIKALDAVGYSNYKTVPVYALKIGDHWFSLSHIFTGIVGWNNDGTATLFDVGKTSIVLKIGDKEYPVKAFNKPHVHDNGPTLYSSVYDATTPKSIRRNIEVIIADGKVQKVLPKSHGKTAIPEHGFVYAYPKSMYVLDFNIVEGDSATIDIMYESKDDYQTTADVWHSMDYILAGTPLLIKNGNIVSTLAERTAPFYTKPHPRTAVGVLSDDTWILLVVEGRQRASEGFTIMELAQYMQQLGCVHALNLDGGGSSSMVINGTLVNAPAGHEWSVVKKERPISHALVVKPRDTDSFKGIGH